MIEVEEILRRKYKIGEPTRVVVVRAYETGSLHVMVESRYGTDWPVLHRGQIFFDRPERIPRYVKTAVRWAFLYIADYYELRINNGLGMSWQLPRLGQR